MTDMEKNLRQEIKELRDIGFKLCQWGVAVLTSLQVSLFFIRQDVRKALIDADQLAIDESLPLGRSIYGTILLVVVAAIFASLTSSVSRHYNHYKSQLDACDPEIIDLPVRHKSKICVYVLYFLFPLVDILSIIPLHYVV